jgi:hypothetical protein
MPRNIVPAFFDLLSLFYLSLGLSIQSRGIAVLAVQKHARCLPYKNGISPILIPQAVNPAYCPSVFNPGFHVGSEDAMTPFSLSPKTKRPLWQTLLAPMLLASLGLHGLFLLIPVASSDEAAIPLPDPEQDNIAITRIPPAASETGATSSPSAATPLPQAVPQRVPPVVAQQRPSAQPIANRSPRSVSRPLAQPTAAPAAPTNRGNLPNLSAGQGGQGESPGRVGLPNSEGPVPEPTIPTLGQNRQETILAYVASLALPEERMEQLAAMVWQRYGYSTLDTSRGDYTDNLIRWQETIQQETGLEDLTAEEDRTDFSVEMERRVCLVQPPGEVRIGFVANPDGSFRQGPVLLRSSGYDELNRKALEVVRQYESPGDDDIKAYTVTVETAVEYGPNDCLEPPQQPSGTRADT